MKKKIRDLTSILLKADLSKLNNNFTPSEVENWDSLNHLNIIATIESEFNIDFEPEEIMDTYKSFDDLCLIVKSKIEQ